MNSPNLLVGVAGACLGAAVTFAALRSGPSQTEEIDDLKLRLARAEQGRDAALADRSSPADLQRKVRDLQDELDRANEALADQLAKGSGGDGPRPGDGPDPVERGAAIAEFMESFGEVQGELAFTLLAERLGLEEERLEGFRSLIDDSAARRRDAFGKFFSGDITLAEMALMEGYDPELDAWAAENLDAAGQAEYARYKEEQEVARVERKASEELNMLAATAGLSAEQKDAAYAVFAEHHARETPDQILAIDSYEQFEEGWETAIQSRTDALTEILDPDQLGVYLVQSEMMTKMISSIVRPAIEGATRPD